MELNTTKCIPASVDPDDISRFRWFGIIVGCFDIIVGGIGNGLTIAAFASNKKLWNTFNIFVINLSTFISCVYKNFINRFNRLHDRRRYDANECVWLCNGEVAV